MYYRIQWHHSFRKRDGNKERERERKKKGGNMKKLKQWNESRMKGAIAEYKELVEAVPRVAPILIEWRT